MQALLEHFITQSVMYSLIAVALVAFLESLALVGLILPGTVMMAGLGALWLAVWLCWRLWRSAKASVDRLTRYLPRTRLLWLAPLTLGVAVVALVALIRHPLMPVYGEILLKVVSR